jgi:hypothetical protein
MKIESYNRKLKYKGNLEKDEVWIDMMRLDKTVSEHHTSILLERLFGKIPSPLPWGVLKVKFYIYKRKPSWIECNGKRIKFMYDMLNLGIGTSGEYYLSFSVKQRITRGINLYQIPVKQSCYPKKTLIKYLLNELVQSNGDA